MAIVLALGAGSEMGHGIARPGIEPDKMLIPRDRVQAQGAGVAGAR